MKTFVPSLLVALLLPVGMAQAQTLTTVVWFDGTDGHYPHSTLIQATDGNLYGSTTGTTINGDYGTIFKMTPKGALSTLVYFNSTNANGGAPWAGLMQAKDGSFYGFGGFGIIKMTSSGGLTDLVNANNSISFGGSFGNLTQGTDGNLYGIGFGGLYNKGVIFSMTTNGTLTDLADFDGTNGEYEIGYNGLTLGKDGNFYGATGGGTSEDIGADDGVVFRMTTNGVLTTLVNFSGTNDNGYYPHGGLIQASDGNFYGTTWGGNAADDGTVFRMTPEGTLATLVRFNGVNGEAPYAGMIQASDGNLYGTTAISVFKLTLNGVLTPIVTFNGTNGSGCYSSLVEVNDGNLYGTTSGGDYGYGTVFKITGLNLLPSFQSITLSNGTVNLAWNSVSNWTYRVQYTTNLTDATWTDLPGDVLATNIISSKTDVAVPTQCFYRLLLLR